MKSSCSNIRGLKICATPRKRYGNHDDGGFELEAFVAREVVGEAQLERATLNSAPGLRGRPALRMATITVNTSARNLGVGTALYEKALELACAEGAVFVSDFQRSPFAEAFWRKQVRLGRARCVVKNPNAKWSRNVWDGPVEAIRALAEEDCKRHRTERAQKKCLKVALEFERRLPRPRRARGSAPGELYWPCGRYAIKKEHCANGSLRGLRSR